jgi:leader peptidase (prepilin peptidase) / N-methyltransferase
MADENLQTRSIEIDGTERQAEPLRRKELPMNPFYPIVYMFGSFIGSFLNVCIYRLPLGKSLAFPASHCPECGSFIRWYHNVPIFGYLVLKGRCISCKAPISVRYPLVEAVTGLISLFLFMKYGLSATMFALFLFCSSLVVVTFIDLKHQIILDRVSLPGIGTGFLFSFFMPQVGWLDSLVGILVGGGSLMLIAFTYSSLTKKDGIGGGDIKLLAMIGAFCGWHSIPFVVFVSSMVGALSGVFIMYSQKKGRSLAIPFGPYLSIAAVMYIFFGPQLTKWYLSLVSFQS